jgi:Tfp pilus assembly protein PilN
MPSINMIALRREEKRHQGQNARKLLYSIAGEVGVIVAVAFVMTARILVAQNHIHDLADQLAKLKPQVAQIQALQVQTVALQPKVDTLDGAKTDTLFWYNNFYAVTDSLPPKTWLTSLGTASGGAPATATPGSNCGTDPTLSLSGVAMSQSMLRMNQSPRLDHVDLSFVQSQKIGKADAVSFQMTVHLKPEAAPAPDNSASKDNSTSKMADSAAGSGQGTGNGTKS